MLKKLEKLFDGKGGVLLYLFYGFESQDLNVNMFNIILLSIYNFSDLKVVFFWYIFILNLKKR